MPESDHLFIIFRTYTIRVKIVRALKPLSEHSEVLRIIHPTMQILSFTSLASTDCLIVDREKRTQHGGEGIAGITLFCSLPGIPFICLILRMHSKSNIPGCQNVTLPFWDQLVTNLGSIHDPFFQLTGHAIHLSSLPRPLN